MKLKKDNTKLLSEKEKDEKQYAESIKKLTEKFERENSVSKNSKAVLPKNIASNELEQQAKIWANDKEHIQKQLCMANAQIDEIRKMNENLMHSYKNLEKSREELQESNNKLTESIQRSDDRNLNLEEKINKLKPYK